MLGGPLLFSALHLIDKGAVKVLVGRISGKKVVQVQVNWNKNFCEIFNGSVQGDSGFCYYLLPQAHYCPCPAYQHSVLGRGALACKHLLAVRLATGLRIHQVGCWFKKSFDENKNLI